MPYPFENINLSDLFEPIERRLETPTTPEYQYFYAIRLVLHKPKDSIFTWMEAAENRNITFEKLKDEFSNQLEHLNTVKSKVKREFHIESFEADNPYIILGLSAEEEMSDRSIGNTIGRISVNLYNEWKSLCKSKDSRIFNAEVIQIQTQ